MAAQDRLVEQVDLFPTLVEAATLHRPAGAVKLPPCPADTQRSRATALCTEGVSLMPLIANAATGGGPWPRAAFSQFVRSDTCCDCAGGVPDPETGPCCKCGHGVDEYGHGSQVMGYTVRVDKYRFTMWIGFNQTSATPAFDQVLATELYLHPEANLPIDWAVEHANVVADPAHAKVVAQLTKVLEQCAPRPDLCPPVLLAGLVH